jgi:hypothetical protein
MKFRPVLVPFAAVIALSAGLTLGAVDASRNTIHTPEPSPSITWSAPAVLTQSVQCQEDDPCWDCHALGNRVCGPANDAEKSAAWDVWEYANGAHSLKVDPSKAFRVEYVGSARDYPRNVTDNEVALVGKDGKWYVFRAAYTS